jgi:hypothetical protein
MRRRIRSTFAALSLGALLLLIAVVVYYPAVPKSILGWLALIVVGIPAYLFVEWLGQVILGSTLFSVRSRMVRIAIAVPVVIALAAGATAIGWGVQWLVLSLS